MAAFDGLGGSKGQTGAIRAVGGGHPDMEERYGAGGAKIRSMV